MPSSPFNQDKELAEFFTDVEHLRDAFKNAVAAPTLTKRILVIHGVGGVGKSSLLRMFRLHCKSLNVPVALASGDEAKSALDILARWTDDLKTDGVAFSAFSKTFGHYREIQAKVDAQAIKAGSRATDLAGKAASKTAEAAGGALAGAAIGSVIPGIGTTIGGALGGVLGGMGAETLTDWLRGYLKRPDINLLLDPAKKLTDDFLADVVPAADKRRIVVLLDTFEQMTALDDWAREIAQRLPANALFVIAGRALPNWSRSWSGWMATAQVEELKPMTEDVMRELIQRYYATMRGGEPDPAQVEAIVRFAQGLPMVVTSAVQLWVKYGVEDFQSVKPEIVAALVDRLLEGVAQDLVELLEAAAIPHWFNKQILQAVADQTIADEKYHELRQLAFVRISPRGFTLHETVQKMISESIKVNDLGRFAQLNERAARYWERRLVSAAKEERESLLTEWRYHVNLVGPLEYARSTARLLEEYKDSTDLQDLVQVSPSAQTQNFLKLINTFSKSLQVPDLEIRVLVEQSGKEARITYVLHSPNKKVDFYYQAIRGPMLLDYVDFRRKLISMLSSVERIAEGKEINRTDLSPEQIHERLVSIGQELYHQLFSTIEFRKAYQGFRDRVSTIQISSDEAWIPWELIRPYDDELGIDDDFWAAKFQMARWLPNGRPPVSELSIETAVFADASSVKGYSALPIAHEEVEFLIRSFEQWGVKTEIAPTNWEGLISRMRLGKVQLWHFSGHGDFHKDDPNASPIILPSGQFLQPIDIQSTIESKLKSERPIVFLNACRVAQREFGLVRIDGWITKFIDTCRVGAFIGPMWSVRDDLAEKLSTAFYKYLKEGESIGSALHMARRDVRSADQYDPTWLSYTLYADPNATVTFGKR